MIAFIIVIFIMLLVLWVDIQSFVGHMPSRDKLLYSALMIASVAMICIHSFNW